MEEELIRTYGNRVRVRVSGLCWQGDRLLMVNHRGLNKTDFWAPPGGGLEFGERADVRLQKEFLEEAGISVRVGDFKFACEFIKVPLHAIELFFDTVLMSEEIRKGDDPELSIISDVRFLSFREIKALPRGSCHGIFSKVDSPAALHELTGFFSI